MREKLPVDPLPDPMYPPDIEDDTVFVTDTTADNDSSWGTAVQPLMLTWQSNQHKYNQDRAIYYPQFHTRQNPGQKVEENDGVKPASSSLSFLVALFDGHDRDGHWMAQFAIDNIALMLSERLNSRPCCQSDE